MKKILFLLTITLLTAMIGFSQAPGILNYQGVARNSVGNVLANKNIALRLTIRNLTAAGAVVYQEVRGVTTNPFGLFNVQLGSPGASGVIGTVAGVNWAVGDKYIQVEIDPNGGSSFINIGTAQLASVPYSLYSTLSGDLVLPFNKTQADAGTLFKITNSGTGSGSTALEGLTNSTAGNANAIIGTVTSTAPGGFSAGVRGINNGTGGSGIGVYGSQAGSGWGVYGISPSGLGVFGSTSTGIGVNGFSTSGTGVQGQSTTGVAGIFINTNAANASDALQASTNGTASSWAIRATSTGAQGAGIFTYNNSGGTANALRVTNNGGGASVSALTTGTGSAGSFSNTNAANPSSTLLVSSNSTTGVGLQVNQSGTGQVTAIYGNISTTTAASTAIGGADFSSGGASPIEARTYGILGQTGTTGIAVGGYALNGGTALRGSGGGATGFALSTTGRVRLAGINEAANRILTSDASGNATWQTLGGGVGIGGAGTLNYVSKWTPDGSNLGNSIIYDNAATTTIGGVGVFTANNTMTLRRTTASPNDASLSFVTATQGAGIYVEGGTDDMHFTLNANTVSTGNKVMTLENTNLNVGINTVAPAANSKLHVDGSGSSGGFPYGILATSRTGTTSFNTHGVWADGSWRGVYGTNLSDVSRFRSIGVQGVAGGTNYSVEAIGVYADANGTGTAGVNNYGLYATASGAAGSNYSAWLNGQVRITDGTQGAGRILTSDAGGNASWQTAASAGIVSGSGTLNFIPKWTPNGTTLGNSLMTDNANAVFAGTSAGGGGSTLNIGLTPAVTVPSVAFYTGSQGFNIHEGLDGKLNFEANQTVALGGNIMMTMVDDALSVGIGTTTPVAKLELSGYNSVANSFTTPTGFSGATGIVSNDATAEAGYKAGVYSFTNGALGSNLSVWGDAGATSNIANVGVFGRVSALPTGTGQSYAVRAFDGIQNANTYGLGVVGRMQLQDGTQGAGKVLTSDASGNASWQTMPAKIAFKASGLTGPVSVPLFTYTPITQWTTINYEIGSIGNYNAGTGTYTIPVTGTYHIESDLVFNQPGASGSGYSGLTIFVNGTNTIDGLNTMLNGIAFNGCKVSGDLNLNAGDLVQMRVFHNTSGSVNLDTGSPTYSQFSIHLVK